MTATPDSLPPGLSDPTAEEGLIGGLMRHSSLVPDTVALVQSETAFTNLHLAAAYRAIATAFNNGDQPTPTRVRDLMRGEGDVNPGLATWLTDLYTASPPLPDDVKILARRVRSLADKRHIEAGLMKALAQVRDVTFDDDAARTAVQGALTSLVVDSPSGDTLVPGTTALLETIAQIEETGSREGLPGLSVGSADLDEVLQGMRPGQLIVVGGRPSVGKSMVVSDVFRAAARQDVGTMLFSLEMTRHQVSQRILSAEARVLYSNVLSGNLSEDEWERISAAFTNFPHHNTTIVDESGLTVEQIGALATQQCRMWEAAGVTPGVIAVDYLQIMRPSAAEGRTRQQEIGQMTQGLKNLAKQLRVSIVLLSQLRRPPDNNPDRRPTMGELRESGDIENDADVIILLHRPDMYAPDDPDAHPGSIFYIVAKNREGVATTVERNHQFKYSKTEDLAARHQWSPTG